MARLSVSFYPAPIDEAAYAAAWYRERNPTTARAFLAELDRAVDRIAGSPDSWPRYAHNTPRLLLHRFPYALVYRVSATEIQVIAPAHGRRRPGYWKDRT